MAETRLERATRYYKEEEIWFVVNHFPDQGMGMEAVSSYFKATTEQANQLGKIFDAYNVSKQHGFEFIGEGEFLGWTIEEITEHLVD
jgi:hypothetical protein